MLTVYKNVRKIVIAIVVEHALSKISLIRNYKCFAQLISLRK